MSSGLFSIGGIVSGLDTTSIVTKTIAAESGPMNQMKAQQTAIQTQMTSFTSLSANLTGLQTSVAQLAQSSTYAQFSATSSNSQAISATTQTGAAAGTYQVTVNQLAQAEQTLSQGYSDPNAAVLGTGTIGIQVGSAIFGPLTVDATNNSLQGLANSINGAKMGVQAAVVNDGTTSHLMLTGNSSGASQTITITSNLSGGTAPTFTTLQAAQDATLQLGTGANPLQIHSPTNQVTNLIPGVTFSLNQANPGTPVTIAVQPDSSGLSSDITSFITAFNTASEFLTTSLAYDASTNTAGPLQGNSTAENVQNQLASLVITNTGSGSITALSQMGITLGSDGTLQVSDQTALTNALNNNPSQVQAFFSDPNSGLMTKMTTFLKSETDASTGILAQQNNSLQDTVNDLGNSITQQQAYLNQQQTLMEQQFAAMEVTLSSLQNESAAMASLGGTSTSSSSSSNPASSSSSSSSSGGAGSLSTSGG